MSRFLSISKARIRCFWCVFRYNVRYLAELLKDEDPIVISGDIPTESNIKTGIVGRDDLIDIFKNSKGKILIATLGSIAESVSLHKNDKDEAVCQHVIYLERDYNAGQYMQSKYRVYRIGSDKRKPIQYYIIQSELERADKQTGSVPTMDHDIDRILEQRERTMHRLLVDPVRLRPVSLEVETHNENGKKVPWGPGESYSDIRKRIQKQMKKN